MLHASIEANNSAFGKISRPLFSLVQDDTKSRLQAIAESSAALHGKIDTLPNALMAVLDYEARQPIEAALISAKDVMALIRDSSKPVNE
jgi:hypothetical protein